MARQREARAANAGEDRNQLEWVQKSKKDAKKGLKNQCLSVRQEKLRVRSFYYTYNDIQT